MSLVPQEVLDEISTRLSIVDIISETVPLKPAGKNFKGLCPFHQEKSPSFTVNPEKNVFHCFGCGEGGSLFTFVMKTENLTFPEAIRLLASKAGVDLAPYKKQGGFDTTELENYYKINRYAAWFFKQQLESPSDKKALSYLLGRGLKLETIQAFKLGYAPKGWDGLVSFLVSKKVPLNLSLKLGLVKKGEKQGKYYDFFRNRIIFPIVDREERVIGFGGRIFEKGETGAKYINSPESPVYHKGRELYGFFQAKKSIRETKTVVLVEGYMDVIRLHEVGIATAVAPLGTSLTEGQIKFLSRFAENFVLMLDGDEAGQRAQMRAVHLLWKEGFHPQVVELPVGEDPDSLATKWKKADFEKTISKALPAMDWILSKKLFSQTEANQKLAVAKKMIPVIQLLPTVVEQKTYLARVAEFLGLNKEDLLENLSGARFAVLQKNGVKPEKKDKKNSLERILLQLYVHNPFIFKEKMNPHEFFGAFKNEETRKQALLYLNSGEEERMQIKNGLLSDWTAFDDDSDKNLKEVAEAAYLKWVKENKKEELAQLTKAIKEAEASEDVKKMRELMVKKQEIIREIYAN